MASSRKSKSSSPERELQQTAAKVLRDCVKPGDSLLLGLSGGIDSIVLLHVLTSLRDRLQFELRALHVNHQLSPNAASWAAHCRRVCRAAGVPLRVVKVSVQRGNSVEAAARAERQRALFGAGADHVVLAHNLDDQAETLLLRLLRGTGVKGLAAMAHQSVIDGQRVLRPFLDVPRSGIARYAAAQGLSWVEDESNGVPDFLRNYLRLEVCPLLERRVPAYRVALARAARHAGEAAVLLDELAELDARDGAADGLSVERLRALPLHRARNLLRHFLTAAGVEIPAAERLEEALRQARAAGAATRLHVRFGDKDLRAYRGRLRLVPAKSSGKADPEEVLWRGEAQLELPGGVLKMKRVRGAGMSRKGLMEQPVTIRRRAGGERLRPGPGRPQRTLKNLLQEAAVPAWERADLPCIFRGDQLVCVPGVATAYEVQAGAREAGVLPVWVPAAKGR